MIPGLSGGKEQSAKDMGVLKAAAEAAHPAPTDVAVQDASSTAEAGEAAPAAGGSDLTADDAERINGMVFGEAEAEPGVVSGEPVTVPAQAAPVSDGDGIEAIADLYRTALGMPMELKGLKRAAEYWNTTGPERMAKPTYQTLMRYEYGRKFVAWLSGGGPGAAEFGLVMAAAAVVRETRALIAQDIAEMQAAVPAQS